MDVQLVSNMCKCVIIIFHIVVAGTYVLYLMFLPVNDMVVPTYTYISIP